jgi:hypothetical protein
MQPSLQRGLFDGLASPHTQAPCKPVILVMTGINGASRVFSEAIEPR